MGVILSYASTCPVCGGAIAAGTLDGNHVAVGDPTPVKCRKVDGVRRWVCVPCALAIDSAEIF